MMLKQPSVWERWRFASSSQALRVACEILSTKTRKLSITHWKGEENPSDGLTKSLRPLSLWTNLVEAVGLVPGPTDQGSNWIRNYLNLIQQESDLDTFLAVPFVASKKGISR